MQNEAASPEERIVRARGLLAPCAVCPRACGANRLAGETGFCGGGLEALVSSAGPHFGEERELVVRRGSGTIFLAGCNLMCIFCQNEEISHGRLGRPAAAAELSRMMLELQSLGCHNINFVTPTHFAPQLMEAILAARQQGLIAPIVYNCGGYESVEMLALLEGLVEIYMPDLKFMDPAAASRLAGAPDYPIVAKAALKEMHRQVGDLQVDAWGAAVRGLLVRHLVLPGSLAGTAEAVRFLAEEISPDTYLNMMDQYRPCFRAAEHPPLDRGLRRSEYEEAVILARRAGLHRGF